MFRDPLTGRDMSRDLDRHITGNYGEDQLKNHARPPKRVKWHLAPGTDWHYRGYVGKLVVFTIHKHSPGDNSHIAIWSLHRGDVGASSDSPLARHGMVGNFDTKRAAQAKAEELAG